MGALRPATRTEATTRGSAIEIAIDGDRREPLVPGEPDGAAVQPYSWPRAAAGRGRCCGSTWAAVRFGDKSWIEVTAVPDDTPSETSRIPSIG